MRMDGTSRANVSFDGPVVVGSVLTRLTVDYNSWVESDTGRRLANSLDKDVVLAEGSSYIQILTTPGFTG